MQEYLEVGRVVNTHGVRGEVKVEPWCDAPEVLCALKTVFAPGAALEIEGARVYKGFVLLKFRGIDTIEAALRYKTQVLRVHREEIPREEGSVFVQDLLGLEVYDERTARVIGQLARVDDMPAGRLFVVHGSGGDTLIPETGGFIRELAPESGRIVVRTIPGMCADED